MPVGVNAKLRIVVRGIQREQPLRAQRGERVIFVKRFEHVWVQRHAEALRTPQQRGLSAGFGSFLKPLDQFRTLAVGHQHGLRGRIQRAKPFPGRAECLRHVPGEAQTRMLIGESFAPGAVER